MNELMYLVEFYENILGNEYSTYFDVLNYISIIVFILCSIITRSISFIGSGILLLFNLFNLLLGYGLTQNSGIYLIIYFAIMILVYSLEEKSNTTTIYS